MPREYALLSLPREEYVYGPELSGRESCGCGCVGRGSRDGIAGNGCELGVVGFLLLWRKGVLNRDYMMECFFLSFLRIFHEGMLK